MIAKKNIDPTSSDNADGFEERRKETFGGFFPQQPFLDTSVSESGTPTTEVEWANPQRQKELIASESLTRTLREEESANSFSERHIHIDVRPPEPRKRRRSREAEMIMRGEFTYRIGRELEKLQEVAKTSGACVYASELFSQMRQYRDRAPYDPFLDVVMALHDALAYNDFWAECSADQFKTAREVLLHYSSEAIDPPERVIMNAIDNLEEAGFDTLPYEIGGSSNLE